MIKNTTIELVGKGHPDRFCDITAEAILDAHYKQDKNSKVAIEMVVTRDMIMIGGEITTSAKVDINKVVYDTIEDIYGEQWWPKYKEVKIVNNIKEQSPELTTIQSQGEIVAGDQGVIYGAWLPERFETIQKLYKTMNFLEEKYNLSPDWKLLYDTETKELSMSVCGVKEETHKDIQSLLKWRYDTFPLDKLTINPKGEWLVGGPLADSGSVGRKLMIDTFGAGIPHGGGAFCGKDVSKVDKTGIIIASYLAKQFSTLNKNMNVIVELNYKIGDKLPTAYAYFEGHRKNVTEFNNLTLDQYIKIYNLKDENWSEYAKQGGVISYLMRDNNEDN